MKLLSRGINGIGHFFVTVVRSCYDMELYRDIRRAPWTRALKYVVTLQATVVLLAALAAAPGMARTLNEAERRIATVVPDGARVTLRSGEFTMTLPSPQRFGDENASFPIVLDADYAGFAPPPSLGKEGGIFIGHEAMFIAEEEGSWRTYPLKDLPDFSYDKQDVLDGLRAYGGLAIAGSLAFFALFFWLWFVFSSVVFVLLMAAASKAIGNVMKVDLRYAQWFAVGLHAVTLPHLLNLAFIATGIRIPFAFTVIFTLFVVSVILDERSNPVGPPETPLPPRPPQLKVRKLARPDRRKPPAAS